MDSRHASLLIAFRGLTERQLRLLTLAAHARGTAYRDQGLLPWWPALQRDAYGRISPIGCHEREPGVQYGLLGEKARKLIDKLCGGDRLPALKGVPDRVLDVLMFELELVDSIEAQVFDLVVKGVCCGGVARIGRGSSRRLDPVYIDPAFATPFWPGSAGSPEAEAHARDLDRFGVPRAAAAPGEFLAVPPGAGRSTLIALRYEPTWLDPDKNEVWRSRTDYLPNIIVNYRPMRVLSDTAYAPEWVPEALEPHDWGLVPLTWVKAPGGVPEEIDGPSLFSPELVKLSYAVDLAESMRHDSIRNICQPQLTLIDLADKVRSTDTFAGLPIPGQESGSGTVMEFESTGDHPSATVTEPAGTGLASVAAAISALIDRAEKVSGLVEHDQSKAAGAMSGVAMEKLIEPTIATVKRYQRPVARLIRDLAILAGALMAVPVDPTKVLAQWPRVVSPTPDDLAKAVDGFQKACGGGAVLSQETAVLLFGAFAELADPEAEWARVKAAAQDLEDKMFAAGGPGVVGGGDPDAGGDPGDAGDDGAEG